MDGVRPTLPYSGSFALDFLTAPYATPLEPKDPLGSMIYDPSVSGTVGFAGDTDSFTIDLDADQTVSVVVDPDVALQPAVEVFDPSMVSLGTATAGAAGQDAVPQTAAATTPETYTVTVGGAGTTTGAYTVQVIPHAAVEMESHNGPSNDSSAADTIVGSLRFYANYAQGMDFDEEAGILYLTA